MKTEHTQTPWMMHADSVRFPFVVQNSASQHVCETGHCVYIDPSVHVANAAHIVLCVNSHEQLVNALQAAVAELEAAKLNSRSAAAGTLHAIKAALASAQPKETHEN